MWELCQWIAIGQELYWAQLSMITVDQNQYCPEKEIDHSLGAVNKCQIIVYTKVSKSRWSEQSQLWKLSSINVRALLCKISLAQLWIDGNRTSLPCFESSPANPSVKLRCTYYLNKIEWFICPQFDHSSCLVVCNMFATFRCHLDSDLRSRTQWEWDQPQPQELQAWQRFYSFMPSS